MPEYGQDTKYLSNSKLSTKQYKEDWGTNGRIATHLGEIKYTKAPNLSPRSITHYYNNKVHTQLIKIVSLLRIATANPINKHFWINRIPIQSRLSQRVQK